MEVDIDDRFSTPKRVRDRKIKHRSFDFGVPRSSVAPQAPMSFTDERRRTAPNY
jgi:hypothetical protein